MLRVLADNANNAVPSDNLAFITHRFNTCSYFHDLLLSNYKLFDLIFFTPTNPSWWCIFMILSICFIISRSTPTRMISDVPPNSIATDAGNLKISWIKVGINAMKARNREERFC